MIRNSKSITHHIYETIAKRLVTMLITYVSIHGITIDDEQKQLLAGALFILLEVARKLIEVKIFKSR